MLNTVKIFTKIMSTPDTSRQFTFLRIWHDFCVVKRISEMVTIHSHSPIQRCRKGDRPWLPFESSESVMCRAVGAPIGNRPSSKIYIKSEFENLKSERFLREHPWQAHG
jgi:hypothetical protein